MLVLGRYLEAGDIPGAFPGRPITLPVYSDHEKSASAGQVGIGSYAGPASHQSSLTNYKFTHLSPPALNSSTLTRLMAVTDVQVFTQPHLHLRPRRHLRALSIKPARRPDPSMERCFAAMRRNAMTLGCAAAVFVILFFPPKSIQRAHEDTNHWKARVAGNACAARHAFACRSLDGRARVCA